MRSSKPAHHFDWIAIASLMALVVLAPLSHPRSATHDSAVNLVAAELEAKIFEWDIGPMEMPFHLLDVDFACLSMFMDWLPQDHQASAREPSLLNGPRGPPLLCLWLT